ncbi:MAG: CPBP family intramembrane metalloprotease [Bdellovibrionaceae bacterium]|jgi:uncharacterized protein|nr:CPBP family intramembrane metalloprotease [Pseudobdellovibrionaceae bacterium]
MHKKYSEKQQLFVFIILTFALSYALEFYIIFNGGVKSLSSGFALIIGLMWIPGVVALFVSKFLSKSWSHMGFKKLGGRALLLAFFIPLVLAFISYYICALLDIREFGLTAGIPIKKILINLILVFIIGGISALGEEIGWRGFLQPKVISIGWKYPALYTGLIWALWHLPLVAFGGYYENQNPFVTMVTYTLAILAFNYFIFWLREVTKSVWVATMAHTSYNFFFQTFWLLLLFRKESSNIEYWNLLGGDTGLIPAALFAVLVIVIKKFNKQINHYYNVG